MHDTVATLLAARAQRRGHPLLICDDERLTYAEADSRSADLARGLVALGAGKGTHVGLLYPNGAAFVVGMLAAARIGAVVVPVSTFQTAIELASQLKDGDTEILPAASIFRRNDYRLHLAGIDAPVDELRSAAMEKLSAFKVPTVWSILDSEDPVPFGATGKPDIHRIREMIAASHDGVGP